MFKRILVPLDGSQRAEHAIPVAARIARAANGSVLLVRIVSTSTDFWPYLAPQSNLVQTVIDADLAEAAKYLESAAKAQALADVQTETIAVFGATASTILSIAEANHTDMIVMCSHGYTGVKRWIMGSVAEKVARHSPIPILVLREGGPYPAGLHPDATQPLRVLVPLDGSVHAKTALEPAAALIAALAAPTQGAMHLVRVIKPSKVAHTYRAVYEEPASLDKDAALDKAKKYLSTTVAQIREGYVAPSVAPLDLAISWSVAYSEDVASAIIKVAENGEDAEGAGVFGGCDIIAMSTHGYSGIQHLAMGSITERVLNATRLPVLIIRPQDMLYKRMQSEGKTRAVTVQS